VDQSSLTPEQLARTSHGLILRHLQVVGQNTIAEKISVDPSTISRDLERVERFCQILAYAGLQVVESDMVAVKKHYFKSMATLASALLNDHDALLQHVTGR
jgi:IS30 family transposase